MLGRAVCTAKGLNHRDQGPLPGQELVTVSCVPDLTTSDRWAPMVGAGSSPNLHRPRSYMGPGLLRAETREATFSSQSCHELCLHAGCRSRAAQPQNNSRGWVLAQHRGRMRRAGSARSHGADHGAGVPAHSPDPHGSPQSREQQGLQEGLGRVEVNMEAAEGSLKWHRRLLPRGRAGRAAPSPLSSPRGHPRGSGAGCPPKPAPYSPGSGGCSPRDVASS